MIVATIHHTRDHGTLLGGFLVAATGLSFGGLFAAIGWKDRDRG